MNFHSIRLLVTDFTACFHFYQDSLGLELFWGDKNGPYADFKTASNGYISLFSRRLMAEALQTATLPVSAEVHFCIVIQVDDLEKTVEALRCKGIALISEPKEYPAWTIKAAHLRDPEGNLIELFVPLDKDRWSDEVRDLDERTSRE